MAIPLFQGVRIPILSPHGPVDPAGRAMTIAVYSSEILRAGMGDQLGRCDIVLILSDNVRRWFRLVARLPVVLQPGLWRNSVPAPECMVECTLVRIPKHVRKINDR